MEFNVTYYVGIMLAQGGTLRIMEDHLFFAPRNIETAMGASDVEIPFGQIKMVEVTGTITESLMVRTQEKTHRFVGGDLQKISDQIHGALSRFNPKYSSASASAAAAASGTGKEEMTRRVQAASERTGSLSSCSSCFKIVKPDYNFCPACGIAIKKICAKCSRGLEPVWKHCAFCGATV